MNSELTWLQAVFHSVSARTAGFASTDISSLNNPAYMTILSLMFIGASPTSTGGGLKTTTLFMTSVATTMAMCKDNKSNDSKKFLTRYQVLATSFAYIQNKKNKNFAKKNSHSL